MDLIEFFHKKYYPDLSAEQVAAAFGKPEVAEAAYEYVQKKYYPDLPPEKVRRIPIIVNNPNDPRLKAYNDSNELYNKSRVSVRKLIDRGYTPSTRFHDGENWDQNPNLLPSRGIKPLSNLFYDLTGENYIKYKSKGELNPTDREVYGGFKGDLGEDEKGKMSGLRKVGVGKFPKPIQPVVYQKPKPKVKPAPVNTVITPAVQPITKPTQQPTKPNQSVTKPTQQPTKPLPFKAKYNTPDTSATPNMQGEYPLRTFYQGTNTQREADSIEDVKGLERIKLQEYMRNNPKKKLKNGGLVKYINGGQPGSQQPVDMGLTDGSQSSQQMLPPVDPMSAIMFVGNTVQQYEQNKQRHKQYKKDVSAFEQLKFTDPNSYYEQALNRGNNADISDPYGLILKAQKKQLEFGRDLGYAKDYNALGFAPYETSTQKSLFKLGGYYNMGGMDEDYATAEVEGNEHAVDPNGTGIQFEGPNHENGGIPVNLEPGTKVFSKRLKDVNGKSFAQNADRLSKKLTKAIKKFDEYPNSSAIENSIAILETQRDEVFNRQEDMKVTKQAKNLLKYGGLIKYLNGGVEPEEDPRKTILELRQTKYGIPYTDKDINDLSAIYNGKGIGAGIELDAQSDAMMSRMKSKKDLEWHYQDMLNKIKEEGEYSPSLKGKYGDKNTFGKQLRIKTPLSKEEFYKMINEDDKQFEIDRFNNYYEDSYFKPLDEYQNVKRTYKKQFSKGGLVKYAFGDEIPDILKEYITPQDTEVQTPAFNYLTDETPSGATPAQTAKFMAGDTPKGYKVDINSALPYAGSLANILMKNPKVPNYSKMPKTTIDRSGLNLMPSKFDINPQLEKSQADVRALEESVNKNISSGSGRFAASLAAKVANMRNRNELYGQKFNVENQYKGDKARLLTQLNSQQAGMDMNVNQFNTGLVNEQLENEYNRRVGNLGLTRQGFVDAAGVKQNQNRDAQLTEADIQKVRIIAQRYGSGVLKRMFDKMVASGQMTKEQADAYQAQAEADPNG